MDRILHHAVLGPLPERLSISFYFDGNKYEAMEGDTIASALLANDVRILRYHEESGAPRGIYCNIGHCFECRLTVNGNSSVRACMTPVTNNMQLQSGKRLPAPLKNGEEKDE